MIRPIELARMHVENLPAMFALMLVLLSSSSESLASEVRAREGATRALAGSATAHLHLVRAEGSELIEAGLVSGKLAGSASARLRTGLTFGGSFEIRTASGAIRARGTAKPHGSGRYQSFAGTFVTTGGNGRYVHISGHGGLYGVFDRRTDSVVIQTTGKLWY